MLTSTNPATGEEIAAYQPHDPDRVERIIERADETAQRWCLACRPPTRRSSDRPLR